jgi:hypothetical protein
MKVAVQEVGGRVLNIRMRMRVKARRGPVL